MSINFSISNHSDIDLTSLEIFFPDDYNIISECIIKRERGILYLSAPIYCISLGNLYPNETIEITYTLSQNTSLFEISNLGQFIRAKNPTDEIIENITSYISITSTNKGDVNYEKYPCSNY